jgi:hypothetical protein
VDPDVEPDVEPEPEPEPLLRGASSNSVGWTVSPWMSIRVLTSARPASAVGTVNAVENVPLPVVLKEATRRVPKTMIPFARWRKPDPLTETDVPTEPDCG